MKDDVYYYVFIDNDLTEQTIATMSFDSILEAWTYLKILAIGIFEDNTEEVHDSSVFGGYYRSAKTGKCLLLK